MLDDEARRALEQEAIALVNLSNSQPLAGKRRSAAVAVAAPKQRPQPHPQPHGPHGHASIPGVHPLLQQNKAALMARRDDRQAPHPHRAVNSSTSALPIYARPPGAVDDRRLSTSVFVDADGSLRGPASAVGGKTTYHPYSTLELSPIEPTTPSLKTEDKSASPTSTTTTTLAALPSHQHHHHHADAHISMQSLLVNLKKRKPEDEPTAAAPTKLPRFRDVFEPARPEPRPSPMPAIKMQATPTVSYAAAGPASPQQEEAPAMVEDSPYPPPPELKCKYRTGKCGNQRALKSCGDYHNLCNYHRLRANANQRKLDRKKKVQRGQPADTSSSSNGNSNGNGSSSEATSPVAAPKLLAASTLASLPSSFLLPRTVQPSQAAAQPHATAPFLTYLVPPPSSSVLGPKPETKSC